MRRASRKQLLMPLCRLCMEMQGVVQVIDGVIVVPPTVPVSLPRVTHLGIGVVRLHHWGCSSPQRKRRRRVEVHTQPLPPVKAW